MCRDLDETISCQFGRFAARRLNPCDVFVGWSSASLEAIPVAREHGARVVIERGSTHIEHQTAVLTEIFDRAGKAFSGTSARIIEREIEEYALWPMPSRCRLPMQRKRSLRRGVSREKLLVNPYGVDLGRFAPPATRENTKPRILFVGQVGRRKGVPELLRAFEPLAGAAELRLVGPVEPGMTVDGGPDVQAVGAVPMDALVHEYQSADVFCLPSWEEGFPLVLLQAMASGLPVVATDATGAGDIVTDGVEGVIVKPGDRDALTAALSGLIEDPDRRQSMGGDARSRVAAGFGWADYGDRAVRLYGDLIAGTS